jgi:hypothetical protein
MKNGSVGEAGTTINTLHHTVVADYRSALSERASVAASAAWVRWRPDFARSGAIVAVEIEGGAWSGGRHVRGSGIEADCQKYNAAAGMGRLVFRLTAGMLDRDPAGELGRIMACIGQRQSRDGR